MPFVIDNSVVIGWHLSSQALRLRLPVATSDGALRDAAMACGVGVFVP